MAIKSELEQDWGAGRRAIKAWVSRSSDFNYLCQAWSCACTNSVAFGSGGIKVCGFDSMFLFGEAWEVGNKGLTMPMLQLCLSHGAREVPQRVLRAAGGHRAVLRDSGEVRAGCLGWRLVRDTQVRETAPCCFPYPSCLLAPRRQRPHSLAPQVPSALGRKGRCFSEVM